MGSQICFGSETTFAGASEITPPPPLISFDTVVAIILARHHRHHHRTPTKMKNESLNTTAIIKLKFLIRRLKNTINFHLHMNTASERNNSKAQHDLITGP
jgi:hypothetical protein